MHDPRLKNMPQMAVVGLSFYGDPFEASAGWTEENEIGRLWDRLMAFLKHHGDEIVNRRHNDAMLEIHIWDDSTDVTGEFDVFVGLEITSTDSVPLPLVVKVLPPTTYAIFTLEGEEIKGD